MNYKYPVSKPSLKGNERKYVDQAMKTGWISSQGPFVGAFESLFSKKHLAEYGVACSSGTNALVLAFRAIGIRPGDEVIIPDFTMVATAWAVSMAGGTPVFVDCWFDNNINVDKIEEAITSRTRVICPVHIYGRSANMERIMKIAHDYNLRVVEDSAEATGLPLRGDIACFSLYANKIVTSGEGGICVTNDKFLAEQMRHLRGMAFSPDHNFYHAKQAYNFRMTNLQAAVALAQTERLEEILEQRKRIEKWYDDGLAKIPRLEERKDVLTTAGKSGAGELHKRYVVWMYDIRVSKFDREPLKVFLEENGIETRRYFKPMSIQPMYKTGQGEYTVAYKFSEEGLYFPTYTDITKKEVDFITSKVVDYYARKENQIALQGKGSAVAPFSPKQEGESTSK